MKAFFIWLLGLFKGLYGDYMWYHLAGYNCNTEEYDGPVLAASIGICIILGALALAAIYYYLINHPSFNKWWHWLLYNVLGGLIAFVGVYATLHAQLSDGLIGDCLVYGRDEEANIIATYISDASCVLVGLSAFILWIIFFFLFSIIIKWRSANCKHTPF